MRPPKPRGAFKCCLAVGGNRASVAIGGHISGEFGHGLVALLRVLCQRPRAHRRERPCDAALPHERKRIGVRHRVVGREQKEQDAAEPIHISALIDGLPCPARLLRRHEANGPDDDALSRPSIFHLRSRR